MLSPQGGSHRCPLWCLQVAADKEPFSSRGGEAPVPSLLCEPSGPLSQQPHLHPPQLNWLKAKGCKEHPLLIPVTSSSLAFTFPPNDSQMIAVVCDCFTFFVRETNQKKKKLLLVS